MDQCWASCRNKLIQQLTLPKYLTYATHACIVPAMLFSWPKRSRESRGQKPVERSRFSLTSTYSSSKSNFCSLLVISSLQYYHLELRISSSINVYNVILYFFFSRSRELLQVRCRLCGQVRSRFSRKELPSAANNGTCDSPHTLRNPFSSVSSTSLLTSREVDTECNSR